MRFRNLGASEISASTVALGTWAIGGWMWGGTDRKASVKAIQAAIDNGINLIDTAPVYGFGMSEEFVGEAVADRRDKVLIATKCGLIWNAKKGVFFFPSNADGISENSDREVFRYLGRESIRQEVEESLRRLKTDHIDLLQTHWQDSTTPVAETMETLLELKKEGKIRAIGVCNASIEQIEEYRKVGQLDCDQEKFSMIDRNQEKDGKLKYTEQNDIAVLCYSPLALGLLSGGISPERKFAQGDQRNTKERFSADNIRVVNSMLEEIKPLASDRNITMAQLVIAWTLHQPGITHALVGARSEKQAIENAQAGSIELSTEELTFVNEIIAGYNKKII